MNSTSSNNKLQGKLAIIIGGASDMGEDTAREFAAHGARAIVIAEPSPSLSDLTDLSLFWWLLF